VIKGVSVTLALLLIGFVCITYIALESSHVVIVESTRFDNQAPRSTHVWFVRDAGVLVLEAGHPDNSWVKDISHEPIINLKGEGIDGTYRCSIHRDPDSHQKVRSLMRSKYGWRDRWIGLFFNISESSLVEARRFE